MKGVIGAAAIAGAAAMGPVAAGQAAHTAPSPFAGAPAGCQVVIPQSRAYVTAPYLSPVQIEAVRGTVKLVEQTASTTLEILVRNPSRQQAEAIVLLPVPEGAVVSAFAFEGTASEPTAVILPREEARKIYDQIVAQIRDPALLEFAGYNLLRSSVFPVPPMGSQRVRLTYEHLLPADGDRVDYVLPRSESLMARVSWDLNVEITSKSSISMVYSPTHDLVTKVREPNRIVMNLASNASTSPGPFLLSYIAQRGGANGVSASIMAYPDAKVGGGYFLMMAGLPASHKDSPTPIRREVTVVLDRSGSMAGVKMEQARAAALQVIEGLDNGEAFNIIDYSTTVSMFAAQPVIKDDATIKQARAYIAAIRATGGTNIHDALTEALRQPTATAADGRSMLPLVLFLTDGLPTVGNTSEIGIRQAVEKGNTHQRRIFTFGVGSDVNVPLLDRLADMTRAMATYVMPQEDVEVKVGQVFKRLYGPVLKDLQLTTSDGAGQASTRLVRELIPSTLPDVYEGDQVILLGQYQENAPVTFTLTGNAMGVQRSFTFNFDFNAATTRNAFVPRLWASRRIAYLVDQIRQAGAGSQGQPMVIGSSIFSDPRYREIAEEILRLSTEFGILTEYTSFLAREGTQLENWSTLAEACNTELQRRAVESRAGAPGVSQGMNYNDMKVQSKLNYDNRMMNDELAAVQYTSVQQVADRAFYRQGNQWVDSRLIVNKSDMKPARVIDFGSAEHIALVRRLIGESRQGVLALPGDILIEIDNVNILIRNGSTN